MQVGVTMRNMGPESTRAMMADCARAAQDSGAESVWITDHVAIPPDDAEGSGGRYVDPLITLAWLAGITRTIKLGSGVIVLPYRPPLMFARQVAALQELSGGRLLLGVGIGWMDAEFRALGIERSDRGRDSDAVLAFLDTVFRRRCRRSERSAVPVPAASRQAAGAGRRPRTARAGTRRALSATVGCRWA